MFIHPGNPRRIEIIADHAFRRGGFLTLQNKSRTRAL
ncbi:hypothetical protein SDC9_195492 [bioreactor metagenome]|uniref:Uncharacterized protein n=1 Tax=bioreactor metagenome TaxID=1076179 RepID=A0A645I9G2_9ZZZZ